MTREEGISRRRFERAYYEIFFERYMLTLGLFVYYCFYRKGWLFADVRLCQEIPSLWLPLPPRKSRCDCDYTKRIRYTYDTRIARIYRAGILYCQQSCSERLSATYVSLLGCHPQVALLYRRQSRFSFSHI